MKIKIFPLIFLFLSSLGLSHCHSEESIEITPPAITPTSWVFELKMSERKGLFQDTLGKQEASTQKPYYIFDFLPEGKTLFSIINPEKTGIPNEGWYLGPQSFLYLPLGKFSSNWKVKKQIIKGLGETANISKPDTEVLLRCHIKEKTKIKAVLECERIISSMGQSPLTAGMGSQETFLATYDLKRRRFSQLEIQGKTNMGILFGQGEAKLTLEFNEEESKSRTKVVKEYLAAADPKSLKGDFEKIQKESPTFSSKMKKSEELSKRFVQTFTKGATLKDLEKADSVDRFIEVGTDILLSADTKTIKKLVPILLNKLKESKKGKVDTEFILPLLLQWLPAITFHDFGDDIGAWEKWWKDNKEKSFYDWAAMALTDNPVPIFKIEALKALGKGKRPQDRSLFKKYLNDEVEDISLMAAVGLAQQKDPSALPILIEMMNSPRLEIRDNAFYALANYTERTLGYDPLDPYLKRQKSLILWKIWLEREKGELRRISDPTRHSPSESPLTKTHP